LFKHKEDAMATKPQKPDDKPSVASMFDSQLASSVKESAQQIWLAGMGAFAKAQEEGTRVFNALVKDGVDLQRKTQSAAEERLSEAAGKMNTMAAEASSKAGSSWDKLENIFEDRTAKALGKLGVPTAREVAELTRRVDELTVLVAQLIQPAAPASAPAKKAAGAKRAAAKAPANTPVATAPVVAKKPAAKRAARKTGTTAKPGTGSPAE